MDGLIHERVTTIQKPFSHLSHKAALQRVLQRAPHRDLRQSSASAIGSRNKVRRRFASPSLRQVRFDLPRILCQGITDAIGWI
jgi:hypothetical protein